MADQELEDQIAGYLKANEAGVYENDYPEYEISLVDGWEFSSLFAGSTLSGLGLDNSGGQDSVTIVPENSSASSVTSVAVYVVDYAYDVEIVDVEALLEEYYADGYYEGSYYREELNGEYDAVFETSSYYDWWIGAYLYSENYYIPYGDKLVVLTSTYSDEDLDNGNLDSMSEIVSGFELDMSAIKSSVVSQVSSENPQITVKNPVDDFFLSDKSYEYDGVNYFGANFGKKQDYDFYLSIYHAYFWDDNYVGNWSAFQDETVDSVEQWSDLVSSGEAMVDGHEAFYYTDAYEQWDGTTSYSMSFYIRYDDESYFNLYYSNSGENFNAYLDEVKDIIEAIELTNGGDGKYSVPTFARANAASFLDIEHHIYEDNIRSISSKGAFEVKPTFFEPERELTRKDFVIWAVRTLQGDAGVDFAEYEENYNGCQKNCLTDVNYSLDDAVYIEFAKTRGAVGANGWFAPDEQVSMIAALKILAELNDADLWQSPDYAPWYLPYLYYGYKNYAIPYGMDSVEYKLTRGEGAFMIDVVNKEDYGYYYY